MPVIAVFCYRVQQQFQVHIHSIAEQINLPRANRIESMQTITKTYVAVLEQHCLRALINGLIFIILDEITCVC